MIHALFLALVLLGAEGAAGPDILKGNAVHLHNITPPFLPGAPPYPLPCWMGRCHGFIVESGGPE